MHTSGPRNYGAEIRKYREQRKLGVPDLARMAGVTAKHVGNVEAGRKGASIDLLLRFGDALGVDPRAFLAPTEPTPAQNATRP